MKHLRGFIAVLSLFACGPVFAVSPIEFKGRTLDLDAYLEGFPYTTPFVDVRTGHLFYKKKGETDELMMLAFDPKSDTKLDLSNGQVISPRDFSKRNLWGAFYSKLTKKVIIEADENNDEVINLYELDPETGSERKLTTTSYIYGFEMTEDGKKIALATRSAKDELSPGDVRVLDLTTGKEKIVFKDSPALKLAWGAPTWQPGDRGLLVTIIAGGSRQKHNLLYVPLEPKKDVRVLTDTSTVRNEFYPLNRWLNQDEYIYVSDEADFAGVYKGSLRGGAPILLTPKGENVKSAAMLFDGFTKQLAVLSGNPLSTTLKLIDPETGDVWRKKVYDGNVSADDAFGGRLSLVWANLSDPFTLLELHLRPGRELGEFARAGYPDELLRRIINCEPEKVSFETFDKLSAPGEKGTLHAYLLKPKNPRTGAEARGLVLSFYGGSNSYSNTYELLCDAGYYVLSPAPRGTTDFGAAFYNLAAGDLGGAETLDDFAAGKYLARRLGIPERHVGIYGGSRGGYDALRALTFPGEVNGVHESFRFGFGIADYGISDIARAMSGGNISQWYSMLTGGDPAKDPAKWRERSPETNAYLLSGPLLLTHGSNDHRVPAAESRSMYAKAKSLGKEVYFLELPGQGHGYKGIASLETYYRAVFDLLNKVQ
jgi:dienelactone hydrolase